MRLRTIAILDFTILVDGSLALRPRTIINSGVRRKYASNGPLLVRLLDSYSTERARGANLHVNWEGPS